jgi:glycosyltransferase involved in cell wall biosynthesis
MTTDHPLVTVLTPVYNGEKYLAECIESVLNQDYKNWEYIIADNCSIDSTLDIANRYAEIDGRIHVYHYDEFVDVIQSHNRALHLISPHSKYCKIVSADDWIYPECITRLVELAEIYPSIAIVGSYVINAKGIRWLEFPLKDTFFDGRQLCRSYLLGANVFGAPTSLLYRADIVRDENHFFPGSTPNADFAVNFEILQHYDYGFVHQILSFERKHEEALSANLLKLNSFLVDRLEFLVKHGSTFCSQEELVGRFKELLNIYYGYLAVGIVNFWSGEFWSYHRDRLEEIGVKLDIGKLVKAVIYKILDLLFNPKRTGEILLRRCKMALRSDRRNC